LGESDIIASSELQEMICLLKTENFGKRKLVSCAPSRRGFGVGFSFPEELGEAARWSDT
jgi:hypothetical protein